MNTENGNKTKAPGDYVDKTTGLLTCGICGKPKEYVTTIQSKTIRFSCICKCEAEKRDAPNSSSADARTERCRKACFPSPKFHDMTFENSRNGAAGAEKLCREYAENFGRGTKTGLFICGSPGTGKTYLASAVCNRLIDRGCSARFASAPELADSITSFDPDRCGFAENVVDSADLTVFDDFGAGKITDRIAEGLSKMILRRYNTGKPFLVTSPHTLKQFKSPKGFDLSPVVSRLYEICDFCRIDGPDRRIEAAKARMNAVRV